MKKAVNFSDRPVPNGFSHAVEVGAGRMLFLSGQVGRLVDGSMAVGIGDQTQVTVDRLNELLRAADLSFQNVVKTTLYITDEKNVGECWARYSAAMPSPPPAATLAVVKALASPEYLVEIEAIAVA